MARSRNRKLIPAEIIRKKRDGKALERDEIRSFIAAISDGGVSNEQIAALAMAIWFQGLDTEEQSHLTLAIRDSGATLDWPDIPGPVLDKHSTGGVGDMVSFAAGPIVAACGGYVPMISGRGLGHTGGTLDKLESFPGIQVTPDIETFQRWVRERGLAIVGQTSDLAPADQRMYAVRDATATVASRPLIVSSIMGKKLCEGLDGLVSDIKIGNGAFMTDVEAGQALASDICEVAQAAGLACTAVLSDMNRPISLSAGNALEMLEIIDYLTGEKRHARFHRVASRVAAEMLVLGDLAEDLEAANAKAQEALDSGAAAEKFESLIAGQGGPREAIDDLRRSLPRASVCKPVFPEMNGIVQSVDLKALGMAVVIMGGGRRQPGDRIDHSVGLAELTGPGEEVGPDQPLAMVHAANETGWESAAEVVAAAYAVGEESPGAASSPILGRYANARAAREGGRNDQR